MLTPALTLVLLGLYFGALFIISYWTSRRTDNTTFFTGNRDNAWYVIAFGMIGTSISGVTFISVPGKVGSGQFGYMQIVLGYIVGYIVIAKVLMPLYYRLNLTSIYQYLQGRFGMSSYKSGAWLFIVSRLLGSSLRFFLAATVLQAAVFGKFGFPFYLTVALAIALIFLYTFRAGVKTVIWTDTAQTFALLAGLVVSIVLIAQALHLDFSGLLHQVSDSSHNQVFFWDWHAGNFFPKQFFGGAAIAIAMTGLDQDMMQKNLSCRSLADAQKNMYWFTAIMVFVNVLFLSLGALLYAYGTQQGIIQETMLDGKWTLLMQNVQTGSYDAIRTDDLFPNLAFNYLGLPAAIFFILGVIAATYASADAALTALTTSFCVDILGLERNPSAHTHRTRLLVHTGFCVAMFGVILLFYYINDQAVIDKVLEVAGYTYGPLMGLFFFGILTKRVVMDKVVPIICLISPAICYVLSLYAPVWFGYKFSSELLILNGLLTFTGLWLFSNEGEIEGGPGSTEKILDAG